MREWTGFFDFLQLANIYQINMPTTRFFFEIWAKMWCFYKEKSVVLNFFLALLKFNIYLCSRIVKQNIM